MEIELKAWSDAAEANRQNRVALGIPTRECACSCDCKALIFSYICSACAYGKHIGDETEKAADTAE